MQYYDSKSKLHFKTFFTYKVQGKIKSKLTLKKKRHVFLIFFRPNKNIIFYMTVCIGFCCIEKSQNDEF